MTSRIARILECFEQSNPAPETELIFTTPFSLLMAVLLSAQATDKSVNAALEPVRDQIDTPEKVLDFGLERLQESLKSLNYYRNKSRYIIETARILLQQHNGAVPLVFEELVKLPGIGRKTANVILNVLANGDRIAVDTHVFRVAHRLELADAPSPALVETQLYQTIPARYWNRVNHWFVLHGRNICKARKPDCANCCVRAECPYYKKTKT